MAFSPEEHADNKQRLVDCLPEASWPQDIDMSGEQARVGVRCASRDHLPFVGDVCQYDQLLEQYADLKNQQDSAARRTGLPQPVCDDWFGLSWPKLGPFAWRTAGLTDLWRPTTTA